MGRVRRPPRRQPEVALRFTSGYWLSGPQPARRFAASAGAGHRTRVTKFAASRNAPSAAADQTTDYTYDGLGDNLTMTAVEPAGTPNEVTTYVYGITTANGSAIDSNSVLYQVQYPLTQQNGQNVNNVESFAYNAAGQQIAKTDRNGNVHDFAYDALGRMTSDTVATLGAGVDGSVRRRRGSDVLVRQCVVVGARTSRPPSSVHRGTVNTTTTPSVQYTYTDMSIGGNYADNSRLTGIAYPNGRVVYYLYANAGDTNGLSNTIGRVTCIANAATRGANDANVIAAYDFMGYGGVVRKSYPVPQVRLDYWGETSGAYTGLDQFGRVSQQNWTNYNAAGANTTPVIQINHGYDQDSNRLYANNQTYAGSSKVYAYDNLNRLTASNDGVANAGNTGILSHWQHETLGWTMDATGNFTNETKNYDSAGSADLESAVGGGARKLSARWRRSQGTNDPGCDAPIQTSQRVQTDVGSMPYGLCSFGHQGLMHDEATGLVYNRARYLNPELGRFMSEDPLGYVDGASLYGYETDAATEFGDYHVQMQQRIGQAGARDAPKYA